MSKQMTISQYRLANSSTYRQQLLGTAATYTTPAGTRVTGTVTEHPINPGGLQLAITTPEGKWASIHAGETITVNA